MSELTAPDGATFERSMATVQEGVDPDDPVLTAPEQNRGQFAGTRSYGSVS